MSDKITPLTLRQQQQKGKVQPIRPGILLAPAGRTATQRPVQHKAA